MNLSLISPLRKITADKTVPSISPDVNSPDVNSPKVNGEAGSEVSTVSTDEVAYFNQVARAVRSGDLESRIDLTRFASGSASQELAISLNDVFDLSDAFAREVGASLEYVNDGKYFRRIMLGGLQGEFLRYATSVNKAVADMGERTADFKQVATSLAGNMKSMISDAASMSAPVEQMAAAARETQNDCVKTTAAAQATSEQLQSVASATEELSSTILQVSSETSKTTLVVSEASGELGVISKEAHALNDLTVRIENILKMITDIAKKTNLLALNATIEAARAGDAGKGFAVVAGEVKSLAKQTSEATDEITGSIQEIRGAMERTLESIEAVSKTIGDVETLTTEVASAVEEQSAAVTEIATHTSQVSQETDMFASTISELNTTAEQTGTSAASVQDMTERVSAQSSALLDEVNSFLERL